MTPEDSAPRRVYHVSPWRRAVPALIYGPMLLGGLALALSPGGSEGGGPGWIVVLVLLPLALGTHWLVSRARLEVSPAGVKLRQTGYTLESAWPEVVSLRLDRGREAFITQSPLAGKGASRLAALRGLGMAGLPYYDAGQQALLGEQRLIPIEAFAWHLRHGSLGADVGRFAPHLQEILAAGPPPQPPLTPGQRRKNWLVGGGLAALVLVGIVGPIVAAIVQPPGIDRFMFVAGGVALALLASRCALSAWSCFRNRSWWLGILFVLFAFLLAFWCIGYWL